MCSQIYYMIALDAFISGQVNVLSTKIDELKGLVSVADAKIEE